MERDGDHYVLNGEKTSISAADQADAAVVFARTGTVESGAHGVSALLVPMDAAGHHAQPLRLPRPARDRARLDLLRERARAGRATGSATRARASCR
jgi:alkylation response protein AidB-like acyl-CoA dehydrogenase